jgi:hypothetical protein
MSVQVTLNLPNHVYRTAERIARHQRREVSDVLIAAIQLEPEGEPSLGEQTAARLREEAAFRVLHAQLRQTHLHQFVAIHKRQLLDSDPDQATLEQRVASAWPEAVVLFKQVTDEPITPSFLDVAMSANIENAPADWSANLDQYLYEGKELELN